MSTIKTFELRMWTHKTWFTLKVRRIEIQWTWIYQKIKIWANWRWLDWHRFDRHLIKKPSRSFGRHESIKKWKRESIDGDSIHADSIKKISSTHDFVDWFTGFSIGPQVRRSIYDCRSNWFWSGRCRSVYVFCFPIELCRSNPTFLKVSPPYEDVAEWLRRVNDLYTLRENLNIHHNIGETHEWNFSRSTTRPSDVITRTRTIRTAHSAELL